MTEDARDQFEIAMESLLSADEITTKEFVTSLRGFDQNEVRAFLARIAWTQRALQGQVDQAATDNHASREAAAAATAEAKRASEALEIERASRHNAERARDEALSALADARHEAAQAAETAAAKYDSADLFELAGERIAAVLRAADETVVNAQEEATAIVTSSRAEADQILADARRDGHELEESAKGRADEYDSQAQRARERYQELLDSTEKLSRTVESVLTEFRVGLADEESNDNVQDQQLDQEPVPVESHDDNPW